MSEKINVTMNVQVAGGPNITTSLTKEVEAYDKVDVTIDAGQADKEVDVQPSVPGQVKFLMISLTDANQYSMDADHKLIYKVSDIQAEPIRLDAPQVFIGKGAVTLLLKEANPTKLFFTNTLEAEVSVQIFVGRDATP